MVDLLDERDSLPRSEDEEKPDKKAAKQLKKLEKALETRVLDPWERYRALSDVFEGYTDVAELLDRKTRFGLIILGALNAINLVVVLRPDLFEPRIERPWLGVYVGCYMALSLYLFVKAIDTLKPRFQGLLAKARGLERAEEESAGLRFMGDVAAQSAEGYYETWHQAQIGQLNRELAQQAQQLARVNLAKFAAANRLYKGLLMLVFLTAGLIMMIAYRVLMG